MHQIVIKNAKLVNEGEVKTQDLLIEGEHISKIADSTPVLDSYQVIDAKGHYLIPGAIDDQVAGGDLIAVLGIIFIILLVLELLGVTNVFNAF